MLSPFFELSFMWKCIKEFLLSIFKIIKFIGIIFRMISGIIQIIVAIIFIVFISTLFIFSIPIDIILFVITFGHARWILTTMLNNAINEHKEEIEKLKRESFRMDIN